MTISSKLRFSRMNRLIALSLGAQLFAGLAHAGIVSCGSVIPSNLPSAPTTSSQMFIGYTAGTSCSGYSGTLTVNATGSNTSVTSNYSGGITGLVGYGAANRGRLEIIGNSSTGGTTAPSFTGAGGLILGAVGGYGELAVLNGGYVRVNDVIAGWSDNSNSGGQIWVGGSNSLLQTNQRIELGFGEGSTGYLNLYNGGTVQAGINPGFGDGALTVGTGVDSIAKARVTGSLSSSVPAGSLSASSIILGGSGAFNSANLEIDAGGTAFINAVSNSSGAISIGSSGGNASLDLHGAGALLQLGSTASTNIFNGREVLIGGFGSGSMSVYDQAIFDAPDAGIRVSGGFTGAETGSGTLYVGSGGTVNADNITVYTGGVLTGSGGIINADVILNGGTLSPGDSPGTMTIIGNLDLLRGVLLLERDGTMSDLLDVSGNVHFGSELAISILFSNFLPGYGSVFDLESFFGASSSFSFDPFFDLARQLTFSGLQDDSYFIVSLGAYSYQIGSAPPANVPEPATLALLSLGLLGLGLARRRA